jgi:hypothetical protein
MTTGWFVRTSSNSVDIPRARVADVGDQGNQRTRLSSAKLHLPNLVPASFPMHRSSVFSLLFLLLTVSSRPSRLGQVLISCHSQESLQFLINGRRPTFVNVWTKLALKFRRKSASRIPPGVCFQSNSTILHLDNPDIPSQPCLSCTKQWCLNQNLPICAGASLGDTDPDTATGKEGDVEARCFREEILIVYLLEILTTPLQSATLPATSWL